MHPYTLVNYADYDTYGTAITRDGGVLDAFGLLAEGEPGDPNSTSDFGFGGGYTDATGLTYLVNRYFDPSTASFISVDPDVGKTGNAYAYASDTPTHMVDPYGLWDDDVDELSNVDSSYEGTPPIGETYGAAPTDPTFDYACAPTETNLKLTAGQKKMLISIGANVPAVAFDPDAVRDFNDFLNRGDVRVEKLVHQDPLKYPGPEVNWVVESPDAVKEYQSDFRDLFGGGERPEPGTDKYGRPKLMIYQSFGDVEQRISSRGGRTITITWWSGSGAMNWNIRYVPKP